MVVWSIVAVVVYALLLWMTWRFVTLKGLSPWWMLLAVFLPGITLLIVILLPQRTVA